MAHSLSTVLGILALVLGLYVFSDRRRQKRLESSIAKENGCEPVIPKIPYRWPLALDLLKVQYDALFSGHTLEALTDYITIAGTVRLELWGVTGFVTTDPKNVETILSTRFEDYVLGSRRLASVPLLGEGIFGQDGPSWKRSREVIRRQFVRIQKQNLDVFVPHVDELVSNLQRKAESGVAVDLKPMFFDFTLGATTKLLFGEPHSSLPVNDRDEFQKSFDYAALGVGIRVRMADLAPLYNPKKFRDACGTVRNWATFFAQKALKYKDDFGEEEAASKYAFIIDLWRDLRDESLVRDQLLHILIAGRDSTAALLSWTFFHLVRNQAVLEKLKKEVLAIPKAEDITRAKIQKLVYLRCCLNETLRLYPQLALNFRFANKPTILPRGGGADGLSPVLIPKGNGVGWSLYHMHRSETLYGPDAKIYLPERWESGDLIKKVGLGAGFVDFNSGPRVCLGKDFALMEASYAIVRIIQAFPNLRLPPGVPNEPVGAEKQSFTIVLSPFGGVEVLLA